MRRGIKAEQAIARCAVASAAQAAEIGAPCYIHAGKPNRAQLALPKS
jgi:hypothetical protein